MFGHDPRYPVTGHWPRLRDQLVDFVHAQAPGQAVHLVAYSLGGYLSLLAACRAPGLARRVVLLDSPVVAGWRAQSLRMARLTGLMKRVWPGRISRTRRWQWPSAEDALRDDAKRLCAHPHPGGTALCWTARLASKGRLRP